MGWTTRTHGILALPGRFAGIRYLLRGALGLALLLGYLAPARPALAATLLTGFTETQISNNATNPLLEPTAMEFAPDGRLFVTQQGGKLRVIKNGTLLANEFASLTVDSANERGLLGVAFDPEFATNHYVYVYYTVPGSGGTPARNRVGRFTANGDVAQGGATTIFDLDPLSDATNHNGGAIHFGPDGKLYVAVGDNANSPNAQSLDTLHGKILRINPDGSFPSDNPFYNAGVPKDRKGAIWALGVRNPYTFAFEPATGRMYINDVGDAGPDVREEINDGANAAGVNFGWPNCQGQCPNPPAFQYGTYRDPLYAYDHSDGCAITGGAFYNPPTPQYPPQTYLTHYFFSDFCGGWIERYDPQTDTVASAKFASGIANPVDLKVGLDGNLYYLARGGGSSTGVWRVNYATGLAPSVLTQPVNETVQVGQSASFSVRMAGTSPLTYQWQRNSGPAGPYQDISNANQPTYTLTNAQLADNGAKFRCVVSNALGTVTSQAGTLTVQANVKPPTVTATAPADGATGVDVVAPVRATFSTDMDVATLTNTNLILVKQGVPSPLVVTVDYVAASRTVTLTPAESLEPGATYAARIKGGLSGVRDAAGNPLAADKVWSFTTSATRTFKLAVVIA